MSRSFCFIKTQTKMKRSIIIILLFAVVVLTANAQKKISETFNASSVQNIDLFFEYPQIVKIQVWDGDQVKIEGSIEIHTGEFNDDFKLNSQTKGNTLSIRSKIENMDRYRNFTVYHDDDDDDNKGEKKSVTVSNNGTTINIGKGKNRNYNGFNIDIELVVTVPKNMVVNLEARYGLVEVLSSPQQMEVEAKYGGVDVSIGETGQLELEASTQWGQIYSNLQSSIKIDGDDAVGKWMKARLQSQNAKQMLRVESQYGNVYLRKK